MQASCITHRRGSLVPVRGVTAWKELSPLMNMTRVLGAYGTTLSTLRSAGSNCIPAFPFLAYRAIAESLSRLHFPPGVMHLIT